MSTTFNYGEDRMTIGMALELSRGVTRGVINRATRNRVLTSRKMVNDIVHSGDTVYGITTGFGPLSNTFIPPAKAEELQENLLKSHSVGVGSPVPPDIVRLMLVLKLHNLCFGYSGVSLELIDKIHWFLEEDIIPFVPSQGSVGASGDLAPLAHMFLPLIGEGHVYWKGDLSPSREVMDVLGVDAFKLSPKEGLALINGTQFISAYAVEALSRLQFCLDHADILGALMVDATSSSSKPFFPSLHRIRPFAGTAYVAARLFGMLEGSEILESHKNCGRVQDPYSIRCMPQVHGASRNAWLHAKEMLHIELNSVTDNPLLFEDDGAISGGNFHGQPMALPLDYVAVAASELGNISDRRIYLSLDGKAPNLPKLLMKEVGVNSGLMVLQYTTAALVSENKCLCFPASADSIPTSMGQEDHVSMGAHSATKALRIVENLEKILSIELICACQALDFLRPLRSTPVLEEVHTIVRDQIPFLEKDVVLQDLIRESQEIIRSKILIDQVATHADQAPDLKNTRHEVFGIY